MILKVGDDILDFNDDVEVERQAKLFERIDSTTGDFSYKFEVPFTSNNDRILTFPFSDVSSKKIYKKINCDLLDNEGVTLYRGYIRVEKRDIDKSCYDVSFFSGNSNWISKLTGMVSDADFSRYDIEVNRINIQNSWTKNDGVVFRLFDSGNLITRSHGKTVVEDWSPLIYAKTIFKQIFNSHSIAVEGELFNDWAFNNLLVCSNTHSESEIDDRTSFVNKTSVQFINDGAGYVKITFQDDTNYPYYNSPNGNYNISTSSYKADSKCKLKLDLDISAQLADFFYLTIFKNGVNTLIYHEVGTAPDFASQQFSMYVDVIPGDIIDIRGLEGVSSSAFQINSGTLKITPIFLYYVKGSTIVPKWSQQQFITNIVSLFNVVSDYDPYSNKITFNFFDRISSRSTVVLPDSMEIQTIDFTEFIGNFGKNNYFSFQDDGDDSVKQYNASNFIKYGSGNVKCSNDLIQLSSDVVQSDFTAPISYINKQFGSLSMEKTQIFDIESSDSTQITGVSNNGFDVARFAISNTIAVGNLVKIDMDKIEYYSGYWVVSSVGTGYFEVSDIKYLGGDTGKVSISITKTTSNDNVYIFLDAGARDYIDISTVTLLYIGNFAFTQPGYTYFNLLNIGKPVNNIFNQGLSWGGVNNKLSYQRSLIDTYYRSFERILNDPSKVYMSGYLSKKTFNDITPLNPVFIKMEQTSNQYYVNRITGYKNSYTPCTMELIKL